MIVGAPQQRLPGTEPEPIFVRLVAEGVPATKKNSMRPLKMGAFVKLVPSAAYLEWRDVVVPQLRGQFRGLLQIDREVNVCALIYRARNVGDLDGYFCAIGDTLQEARVLDNDRLISGWDGSRRLLDPRRPRVELVISDLDNGGF